MYAARHIATIHYSYAKICNDIVKKCEQRGMQPYVHTRLAEGANVEKVKRYGTKDACRRQSAAQRRQALDGRGGEVP